METAWYASNAYCVPGDLHYLSRPRTHISSSYVKLALIVEKWRGVAIFRHTKSKTTCFAVLHMALIVDGLVIPHLTVCVCVFDGDLRAQSAWKIKTRDTTHLKWVRQARPRTDWWIYVKLRWRRSKTGDGCLFLDAVCGHIIGINIKCNSNTIYKPPTIAYSKMGKVYFILFANEKSIFVDNKLLQ